jgi:hypothetical protein
MSSKEKALLTSGAFSFYVGLCVAVFAPEPVGPVFVLAAMLPIVERGQAMDGTLA